MPRIQGVSKDRAEGSVKDFYEILEESIGFVPNVYQAMANSPHALFAYISANERLAKGSLSKVERETIALIVGEHYSCRYCLAVHMIGAENAGLSTEEALEIRRGNSSNPKLQSLIWFVRAAIQYKARLSNTEITKLRGAGFSDAQIVEVLLSIGLCSFMSIFNQINETPLDFPEVPSPRL
jgi:uncharacterized peroxidase-related enzyme